MPVDDGTAVAWYVVDEVTCVGNGGYVVYASPAAIMLLVSVAASIAASKLAVLAVCVKVDAVVDCTGK